MTRSMKHFCLLAALLTLPTIAHAQMGTTTPMGGTAQEQKACNGDARRHCRAVLNQGDSMVLSCLQQNRTKLTRACLAVLQSHGQ